MALDDMSLRQAKARESAYKMYDAGGLFLLVRKNGNRLWQMKFKRDGKEKLLSFGAYPTVTLTAARQKRDEAREKLAAGIDPAAERQAAKVVGGNTFKEIASARHERRKHTLVPAHEQRVWARLERDVFPEIGEEPIDAITAPRVLEMLRKVEERGSLTIAKRLRCECSHIFRFAMAEGLATNDPADTVRKALTPSKRVKHMNKLPLKELPKFLSDLEGFESERTRLAIRLLILTWARTNEIRFAAKWEFENLDGPSPVWRIPGGRMKMNREHIIPLSPQAVSKVKRLFELAGDSEYLFPGSGPDGVMCNMTMLQAVYTLGYKGRVTVHGFRGVASTWANEALTDLEERKYHPDWVEMALAHSEDDDSRGAYNAAEYLAPRRRMLADWAAVVEPDDFDSLL